MRARGVTVAVTLSRGEKAASRAAEKRRLVAAKQAAGDHRGAFLIASNWLLSEMAKVARHRPRDAAKIYSELTQRLVTLAAALPTYKPQRRDEAQ